MRSWAREPGLILVRSVVSIRRALRVIPARLVAYALTAYLAAGAVFYFRQHRFLFPAPENFDKATPAAAGISFEDLRIPVRGSGYIHSWWIPASAPSETSLLVFHGNGYVLEQMMAGEVESLHQIRANLLLIDYRSYGNSSAIEPDEITLNEDGATALGYLIKERHVPLARVYILGRSIGSGPATWLAFRNPGLGGLILESPFTSIDEAATTFWYFRIYPLGLLLRTHFDNLSRIRNISTPLLIVAGTADRLTPAWMANELYRQAHQPKQLYLVPGAGHDDLPEVGGDGLLRALQEFIAPDR